MNMGVGTGKGGRWVGGVNKGGRWNGQSKGRSRCVITPDEGFGCWVGGGDKGGFIIVSPDDDIA